MQCPNCRKTEKGQWLYASGCRSLPEFSLDDWAHEEDLYDLSYSEMVKKHLNDDAIAHNFINVLTVIFNFIMVNAFLHNPYDCCSGF